jgi:alpha-L-arabinofuranosidase
MAYFLFNKNLDNVEGSLYKIAENQSDLNNLNIDKLNYKIIEDSQSNFDSVKYGTKIIKGYNNNNINYADLSYEFKFTKKQELQDYIEKVINQIKCFLDNNKNHLLFNNWNNYYNQLKSLDLDSISYPLGKSLEQYFKDQNLLSLNPLQLP